MFASYSVRGEGYGYMCFETIVPVNKLLHFLESRIRNKITIIFMSQYSTRRYNDIYMYTDGVYRFERWNKPIRDPEEIDCLYSCLYNKYGFTNILGYY